ncbi:hypothetical protein [Streptomyces sp. MnatMP-M27]|uniref:hypothetical protein n=1 Tax=Streptomyces sp. MnatMP-M27 TaxID=1839768 RepID=UPI00210AC833|nr:hypothetical protein [Streptomyces sp. MnatMP-M27]
MTTELPDTAVDKARDEIVRVGTHPLPPARRPARGRSGDPPDRRPSVEPHPIGAVLLDQLGPVVWGPDACAGPGRARRDEPVRPFGGQAPRAPLAPGHTEPHGRRRVLAGRRLERIDRAVPDGAVRRRGRGADLRSAVLVATGSASIPMYVLAFTLVAGAAAVLTTNKHVVNR